MSLKKKLKSVKVIATISVAASLFGVNAFGGATQSLGQSPHNSNEKLTQIRKQVLDLEQEIVDGMHSVKQAKANMKKIQNLMKLQKEERALGEERSAQLSATVTELETRKQGLDQKISDQRALIRKSLIAVERSIHTSTVQLPEQEILEAPRRKVLAALVQKGITEVEALKIDLADADELENKIADERQQLTYLFADLDEQKGILELNRQLQIDIVKRHDQEHVEQLDNYRKLKVAESQVENLIQNFNSRVELQKNEDAEKQASMLARNAAREVESTNISAFARLKGVLKLPLPGGKILTAYGRAYDAKSGLYVFKKGIDIHADKKQTVHAIYSGKVAYSGELPDYGKVAIIDHGGHFYSLCAHLGSILKKTGDTVAADEAIGLTDDLGTSVYFEIRSRNVAVNPLQWISN